jgi:hypothetical protein
LGRLGCNSAACHGAFGGGRGGLQLSLFGYSAKIDYQGCSEFNPVLMFSDAENKDLNKPANHTKRNQQNAPNRRVMALLFRAGTVVDPGRWPCPSWKDGVAACKKRFWSDADSRRQFQAKRRTFDADKNTYACRFYHRLFELSPCATSAGPEVITVLEVKALVQGTKSLRDASKRRPTAILRASNSTHDSQRVTSLNEDHSWANSENNMLKVGVITAFNFPVAVWAWNAALALVCGDSVIWKPSEKTPLTALATRMNGETIGEF